MKWIALFLAMLSASAFLIAAPDDEAAARAQVLALEKAWNQAYKAGDIKALDAILDNSLVLIEDDASKPSPSSWRVLKRPVSMRSRSLPNRSPYASLEKPPSPSE